MRDNAKEPCIRCGELIYVNYAVHLRTAGQLSKLKPSEFVDKIVQLEGVPRDVAQDFVNHKMGHACVKTQPPCPACRAPLKTWHAMHCLQCDWNSVHLKNNSGAT
jgi:hypothetical protein